MKRTNLLQPPKGSALLRQVISLVVCVLMIMAVVAGRGGWIAASQSQAGTKGEETISSNRNIGGDKETLEITTTDIGKDIRGFAGATPVAIYIREGRIDSVVALPNQESPRFFDKLRQKGLLKRWNGRTVAEAAQMEVDAVTGATYSSRGIIDNVRAGLAEAQRAHPELCAAPARSGTEGCLFVGKHDTGLWKWLLGLTVVTCAAVLPLFIRSRVYRVVQQVADVAVLGLWCGSFVSYVTMVGTLAHGSGLGLGLVVAAMLVVAFLWPLLGRKSHYCQWVCPLGAAQELAGMCSSRKWRLSARTLQWLTWLRRGLWAVLMLLLWTGVWLGWMDYELFAAFMVSEAPLWMLIVATAFLLLSVWVPRPYCRFICPTGTLLKISQSDK